MHPTTPTMQPLPGITHARFSLIRFRSPLLTESQLFSLPAGTEMFHFPTFPPTSLYIQLAVTHTTKAMHAGFPHSDILVSPLGYQLHQAYRRFPRPSSAPIAKASTVRPSKLTQPTTTVSRISHKLSKHNTHTQQVQDAVTQIQTITSHHIKPQKVRCKELLYKDARVHYTVTTTTPHQHQSPEHNPETNTSRTSIYTRTPPQHTIAMSVVVPKPNSMPKSPRPRPCSAPASTDQPPNRAISQYYQKPTTITDQDHTNTPNRMPNMICLMFHPRSHTTNHHNDGQYQ